MTKYGTPNVLKLEESHDPIPRNGELRIKVEASGVSFLDLEARMGKGEQVPTAPFVPGFEVAGTVELVGQGVPDFQEGDSVFALTRFGGYADTICVPYYQVFKRLQWMPVQDAAALPLNYLTAYLLVRVFGSVQSGDKVLIHNAGGGVGSAAVDICRIMGAEIFGTASPEKFDYLRGKGVQNCIDYRNQDYERVVKDLAGKNGVQVILDGLGGVHWPKNGRLLSKTGRHIYYGMQSSVNGQTYSKLAHWRNLIMTPIFHLFQLTSQNRSISGVNMLQLIEEPHLYQKWMKQIISWYDEALFRPNIDKEFLLSEAEKAHRYLHNRQNKGKVVLMVTP
ncbi:MAG: zinc-binding dehydrogenase [Chloroflexota bacterium]